MKKPFDASAPQKRAKKINKLAECTPREQRFVLELASGKDKSEAAEAVGLSRSAGHLLYSRPRVQNALQETLYRMYPELDLRIAGWLGKVLDAPDQVDLPGDANAVSIKDKLAVVKQLVEVLGHKAPERKLTISADVTDIVKFPTEGDQ